MRRGLGMGFFWLVLRWNTLGGAQEIPGLFGQKCPLWAWLNRYLRYSIMLPDPKEIDLKM